MLIYWMYKMGEFVACILPWRAAYRVGMFFGDLQYYFSKKDRDAVINNLKVILPKENERNVKRKAREVFENFGLYMVEFFRSYKIDHDYVNKFVTVEGAEILDKTLKDTGAILLTAHIGNWELGGMVLSMLGYPSIAIALNHAYHKVNTFFTSRRQEKGLEVIHLGPSVRRCFKGLKEKKLIAILGERDFSNSGYKMKFLSKTKIIPRGPAVLAKKADVPIIPAFAIRKKFNYLKIKVLPPIYVNKDSDEKEIMQIYSRIIEQQIYKNPTQWLMFREFWKE